MCLRVFNLTLLFCDSPSNFASANSRDLDGKQMKPEEKNASAIRRAVKIPRSGRATTHLPMLSRAYGAIIQQDRKYRL
ncbi:hypothetical protein DRO03_04195 [Methanosarcinales archaeon]|nr:MAG: hypothetical protein DRO03_04195 [Methanosarcinales archaeon]